MRGNRNDRWITLTALAVLCAIAACLRAWTIANRPIWFDEAFSWMLATEFSPRQIIDRTSLDVHPPLYYLLLSIWTAVCGDSLTALRSLSVVLGTATVLAAWALGRTIATVGKEDSEQDNAESQLQPQTQRRVAGLIFAGLVATSAFQIRW